MFILNLRNSLLIPIALLLISSVQLACNSKNDALPLPATTEHQASARTSNITKNLSTTCIDNFKEGTDYFPEKIFVKHAKNFSIEYHDYFKVLRIPEGTNPIYILVQCGAPKPALTGELKNAIVIQVPIKTLFTSSSAQIPALVDIARIGVLTGHAQTSLVLAPSVIDRISAGKVVSFAENYEIDVETVIAADPKIVLSSGFEDPAYPTLRNAGITVVDYTDWLEETPLARAEWPKVVAALLNEELTAEENFTKIEKQYNEIKSQAKNIPEKERPTITTGLLYGDIFYAAGGSSYVAFLIQDAGGLYVWKNNNSTGSLETDLETAIEVGGNADIWINCSLYWPTLDAAKSEDARFAEFKSFKNGRVWNYSRVTNTIGGFEYFEKGVTRPDLILADLMKIFHPELSKKHNFEWYQKIPER